MRHGVIGTYTNHKCRCNECREAWRIWQRRYLARTRDKHSARSKMYRLERRSYSLSYLGGQCRVCGSTENLEFDHVDPDSKHKAITSMLSYSLSRLHNELDKCQLLCHDCHWDKTRANGRVGRPKTPEVHGTTRMYRSKRCRCDACKQAMSEENRRAHLARKARL